MTKYQFFSQPGKERRQNFTFLLMENESFTEEKAQLLNSGLKVDGDVIVASSDREAVERYKSNLAHLKNELAMAKYQFFCQPGKERQNYTFLLMGTESFVAEKTQLLNAGLEVDGDVIFAVNDKEAVEKYKSNFIHLTDEMNNSHVETGVISFVIEVIKTIKHRWSKR